MVVWGVVFEFSGFVQFRFESASQKTQKATNPFTPTSKNILYHFDLYCLLVGGSHP